MTAADLVGLGIVDEVLPEPLGGAHRAPAEVFESVGTAIARALDALSGTLKDELVQRRYERLRVIGEFCTLD